MRLELFDLSFIATARGELSRPAALGVIGTWAEKAMIGESHAETGLACQAAKHMDGLHVSSSCDKIREGIQPRRQEGFERGFGRTLSSICVILCIPSWPFPASLALDSGPVGELSAFRRLSDACGLAG